MHITVTKASTIVITNAGFITMFYTGKLILNIFVGRLRDIEIEEIIDQGRVFLLDTIFFLLFSSPTINNVEVGAMVLSKYITLILLLKMLHLITHIRINHMFEVEKPKVFSIMRIAILLNILLVIDLSLIFRYLGLLSRESTLRLWVFFESVSLFVSCVISIGKYIVHIIDLKIQALQLTMKRLEEDSNYQGHGDSTNSHTFVWSNKNAVLFYMEVVGDICSLISYLLFIILFLLLNPSRIPLYIMGDIFHIIKALYNKLSSFRRYRKLTRNMETKFQEATLEEIERVDTCIVCRDTLYIGSKKIPCGHVFHLDCLKSWFIQQQTCPICRSPINIQDDIQENGTSIRSGIEEDNNINFNGDLNNTFEVGNHVLHGNLQSNNVLQDSEVGNYIDQINLNKNESQNPTEINIKALSGILKGLVVSEIQSSHNTSNQNTNLNIKKYKLSTHPLLNRNHFRSTEKSSTKNYLCSHDGNLLQVLTNIPQDLLKTNQKILEYQNCSEKLEFVPGTCEIYRKNADIWLNNVNYLINFQPNIGSTNENHSIYPIITEKGNYFGQDSLPFSEGNEMKNSFNDLLNTVRRQVNPNY
ncbi:HRD1 like membrane associated RING finger containing protein [Cryptosporidium ryanae]|uniref:HRD1 like membrane associated RING finger containing protein n=1 Tax=Cryptosporidium ryanae TaxID=515981 RepID=UPI00351A6A66|nr:HRD1 like membrane associated RING finger containing protein [Cryptosporidium ryanae]